MELIKLISTILILSFYPTILNAAPSSEIPNRREFPLSKKIKPCDDFYQYVCSEALDNFKLREDRSSHTFAFSDSYDRILNHKKSYLSGLLSQKNFNERSQQLHDFYASCMDRKARAVEEREILQKKIKILAKIKSKKEFFDYLITEGFNGKFSHIRFLNRPNLDNPDKYDFLILPRKFMSLPEKSYYLKKELMADFEKIIIEFYKIIKAPNPQERAQWVIKFQTDFANNYPVPAEARQRWSQRSYSTKKELLKLTSLRFDNLLKKVPSKIKIRNPMNDVFVFLDKFFKEATLEQTKSVYLYMATAHILDEAYPNYFKQKFSFSNKYLGGPKTRTALNERCAQTMWGFNKEIDAELFDKLFPNFPEEKFISTLQRVKTTIAKGMQDNKWMSKKSKKGAINKIKLAKFQVVKPRTEAEWDFNPKANYNAQKFLGNRALLNKNKIARDFKRLPKKVNRDKWYMGPLTVNAYYDPPNNKFVMPAGILQYPFYDAKLHEWQNLGAVGAVVGHELGHGVDDQGAKYDAHGKLNQWMSDEDVKQFKKRGEKLVAHFDKAGHNGKLTLGENIGDLVGLTFAYKAALETMPTEPKAKLKAQREFYIQYARVWCTKMRPKMAERRLKTGPHSLGWARVNEQVKHQAPFAQAFSCKESDKMTIPASERVEIW